MFDLKPFYRESLAYFEAFRRLGYPARSIYFGVSGTVPMVIHMILRHDGREFVVNVHKLPEGDRRQIIAGWKTACLAWKAAPEEDRQVLWNRSYVVRNSVDFAMALVGKGFAVDPTVLREDVEN